VCDEKLEPVGPAIVYRIDGGAVSVGTGLVPPEANWAKVGRSSRTRPGTHGQLLDT
jgi:hypothetical protein